MSPIRLGFLTPSLRLGGAERWILSLASNFDPKRVSLVGTALTEYAYSSTSIAEKLSKYMPIFAGPIHKNTAGLHDTSIIQRFEPNASVGISKIAYNSDVIISWGCYHLDIILKNYIKHTNLLSVSVSHCEGPVGEFSKFDDGATHFVSVCRVAKSIFSEEAKKKCIVIHNGADIDRVTPTVPRSKIREEWGLTDRDKIVGYVGRFSPEKNPTALVKALQCLSAEYKVILIGEGLMEAELKKELQDKAPGRYKFIAPINQIGNALQALDALVLPSYTEAFSLSMIEAWLAGTPVVSTPVGALRELESLFGDIVIEVPYAPEGYQLAEGIKRAVGFEGYHLARKCRKIAWSNFTAAAMTERWTRYLESIVLDRRLSKGEKC